MPGSQLPRPLAMQDWERQGLVETHREIGHEEEMAAAATVTADYRS